MNRSQKLITKVKLLESVSVNSDTLINDLRIIQTGIKADSFNIEDIDSSCYSVAFNGNNPLKLLVTKLNSDTGHIIGYNTSLGDKFRAIPDSYTSFEEIANGYKVLAKSKSHNKLLEPSEVLAKSSTSIQLGIRNEIPDSNDSEIELEDSEEYNNKMYY